MNLDIPKIGYIILIRTDGGFVDNQIEKTQLKRGFSQEDAKYIHCAVSCGGQWIVEVSPPKTKMIDIRKKYKYRYIKILRYANEEYERKGRYKIALWATSQCNLRYDWFGALALKFRLFWQWKSRPFCSENSLWAFQREFPDFAKTLLPEDCMPAHWLAFKEMALVWEGVIK